jgi:hypothetical protein
MSIVKEQKLNLPQLFKA